MVRVLFVCLGNICRSPLSQGVFENVLRREGLEGEVEVDSAGTGAWHVGHPPDKRGQRGAKKRGIDIRAQRARRPAAGRGPVGRPPGKRGERGAKKRGIDISAQRARRLTLEDCERFDYILFMDEENRRFVEPLCGGTRSRAEVRPFLRSEERR